MRSRTHLACKATETFFVVLPFQLAVRRRHGLLFDRFVTTPTLETHASEAAVISPRLEHPRRVAPRPGAPRAEGSRAQNASGAHKSKTENRHAPSADTYSSSTGRTARFRPPSVSTFHLRSVSRTSDTPSSSASSMSTRSSVPHPSPLPAGPRGSSGSCATASGTCAGPGRAS